MKALRILFLTAVVLAALYGRASAQVCGDADASGTVTVTDGVQVLRAAAGLSSTCSEHAASCDVDGSGTATVSDGVNVLRKAAGLPITEACPTTGGSEQVAEVTDTMVPFITLGLSQVPNVGISSASAVRAAATEDCEDGGSRTTNQSGVTVTVEFDACRVSQAGLGSFQLDGEIVVNLGFPNSSVQFELNVTDLANSRLIDFDGTIQGTPRVGGGFVLNGGPIVVRESEGGPEVFRLTFDALTVDGDGHLLSGSVEAEDTSDSFDLHTAEVEIEDGSSTAHVHVVRDDNSTQDFTLNLNTGDLTPVN